MPLTDRETTEGATGRRIRVELGQAYPTLNRTRKLHFAAYARHRKAIALEIKIALGKNLPNPPFVFARVLIERRSSGMPDDDNLRGGAKALIDCLVSPQGGRHPDGLGIILDDNPFLVQLEVRPVLLPSKGKGSTMIEVIEIDPEHPKERERLAAMGVTPEAAMLLASRRTSPRHRQRSAAIKAAPPARMSAADYQRTIARKGPGGKRK
jgi:hypothetical protein